MINNMLPQFSYAFSNNGGLPAIWLIGTDGTNANLLQFLENNEVISIITYMRDALGVLIILNCILDAIQQLQYIINGQYEARKSTALFGGLNHIDD